MKALCALALLMCSAAASAWAQSQYGGSGLYGTGSNPNSHFVSPYVNSHGTYVQGHHQTNPNTTQLDNFGSRGNHNPYAGTFGTRSPLLVRADDSAS
jgi:hypothetical protein